MADHWLLADAVNRHHKVMTDPTSLDFNRSSLAVDEVWNRDDALERIPLRATCRGDVGLTTRNSNREVEHAPDGLCRNAWPVVGARDPGPVGGDDDAGRD